jgi:hypothetical protein
VSASSREVEAIEVHHLVPGRHEVAHELPPARRCTHRPRRGRGAGSSSRRQIDDVPVHLSDRSCGRALRARLRPWRTSATSCPCRAGSRRSRWSGLRPLGEHAVLRLPDVGVQTRRPPIRTVISGAVSVSSCALSTSSSAADGLEPLARVVAEPVGDRLQHGEGLHVGLLLRRVHAPGEKGTVTSWPAFFAAASTAAQPPRTIRSASETFLPPDCAPLNSPGSPPAPRGPSPARRLVDLPVLLRREADARAVGAAALVAAAEGGGRRPGGGDQLGDGQAGARILAFRRRCPASSTSG